MDVRTALMVARDEPTDSQRWEAVEDAIELMLEGAHSQALERLRAAIEDDPRNAYAYHHLGAALFEIKQLAPARDAYRAAVKLAPRYLGARIGLSHALRLLGDHDGACMQAQDALQQFPDDGDALYAVGLALAAQGHRTAAVQKLERFLETGPEFEVQLEVRGIIEMISEALDGGPFELK